MDKPHTHFMHREFLDASEHLIKFVSPVFWPTNHQHRLSVFVFQSGGLIVTWPPHTDADWEFVPRVQTNLKTDILHRLRELFCGKSLVFCHLTADFTFSLEWIPLTTLMRDGQNCSLADGRRRKAGVATESKQVLKGALLLVLH